MSQVLNPLLADTQDAPPPFSSSSCGVYSSASVPYTVLFKQGDDVRQDELAVQLVRFMDRILKGAGMDLRILTYEVLSIGPREVRWTLVTAKRLMICTLTTTSEDVLIAVESNSLSALTCDFPPTPYRA